MDCKIQKKWCYDHDQNVVGWSQNCIIFSDTSEFDALDRDASSEELLATPQEASQFMYITGISFAMFVLVVSIIVHYYDSIMEFVGKLLSRS